MSPTQTLAHLHARLQVASARLEVLGPVSRREANGVLRELYGWLDGANQRPNSPSGAQAITQAEKCCAQLERLTGGGR